LKETAVADPEYYLWRSPYGTASPSCALCLLKVTEECDKMLMCEETILDLALCDLNLVLE
jgi:hypothetical protein